MQTKVHCYDNQDKVMNPTCANCQEVVLKPMRCGACKTQTYCGTACQKTAWPAHKRACKETKANLKVAECVRDALMIAVTHPETRNDWLGVAMTLEYQDERIDPHAMRWLVAVVAGHLRTLRELPDKKILEKGEIRVQLEDIKATLAFANCPTGTVLIVNARFPGTQTSGTAQVVFDKHKMD